MENSQENAIHVNQLSKQFGDFTAVNQISFYVKRGEIFGFLGPNGSGKTTTIRMLLGLLKPNSGNIDVLGVNVSKHPHLIRPRVGYMSQRFTLYNDLTVLQNLNFYGRAYGLHNHQRSERIKYALEMAGLQGREDSLTKELSGGWRQRLALGASILHHPELVFLDEPTAGVDPVSRRAFWDLLYQLASQGITVFVTTHYMDEAEHCHRLAFIQSGQIIAEGTPQSIKTESLNGEVVEVNCSNPAIAIQTLETLKQNHPQMINEIRTHGALIHILLNQKNTNTKPLTKEIQNRLIKAGVTEVEMEVIQPTLEDVFISRLRSAQINHDGGNHV